MGKPPREEWPKENVVVKYDSFEIVDPIGISLLIPNLCSNAEDLIRVSINRILLYLNLSKVRRKKCTTILNLFTISNCWTAYKLFINIMPDLLNTLLAQFNTNIINC